MNGNDLGLYDISWKMEERKSEIEIKKIIEELFPES